MGDSIFISSSYTRILPSYQHLEYETYMSANGLLVFISFYDCLQAEFVLAEMCQKCVISYYIQVGHIKHPASVTRQKMFLQHFYTLFLKCITPNFKMHFNTQCMIRKVGMEDLLSTQTKKSKRDRSCFIGSMDVKALYPSLDIDFADRKMC